MYSNNNLILHANSQRVRKIFTAILLPMTLCKSRIITLSRDDIYFAMALKRPHLKAFETLVNGSIHIKIYN